MIKDARFSFIPSTDLSHAARTWKPQIISHSAPKGLWSKTLHFFSLFLGRSVTAVMNILGVASPSGASLSASMMLLQTATNTIFPAPIRESLSSKLPPILYFEDVQLTWRFVCMEGQKPHSGEKRLFELSFKKKHKEQVLDFYLPYVLLKAEEIKNQNRVIKLYSRQCPFSEDDDERRGSWGSIILEHPATFDTLAMDPDLKKMIIDDLERFLRRKDYYKKVGKAWKRGYLLYGPPGTGKSSLVAAMANYLKFDLYDLGLTSVRSILLSTSNRSILLIEDIDCSSEVLERQQQPAIPGQLTLSGILNCIDGLWSNCGDERIIVFTTNYKDRLDPALLRPGRMDLHINMSYCTTDGFRLLASNYLSIGSQYNPFFGEIDELLKRTEATPAEVAEELMKNDDANAALQGLVNFLKRKRNEANEIKNKATDSAEVHASIRRLNAIVSRIKRSKTDGDEKKLGR